MTRIFIPGTHMSFPMVFKKWKDFDEAVWEFCLDKSLLFKTGNRDFDEDFRKLTGIKEDFDDPRDTSFMAGFRPSITNPNLFDLVCYYHIDGDKEWSLVLAQIEPDEKGYVRIVRYGRSLKMEFYDESRVLINSHWVTFPREMKKVFEINPWYGGDLKAKWGMRLWLKRLKEGVFEPQDIN